MKKTVFIVGAGASTEFGLPLGSKLADDIRTRFEADLAGGGGGINSILLLDFEDEVRTAVEDLCGGLVLARSIDRLLDSRKDRPLVLEWGKRAIATLIGIAEGPEEEGDKDTLFPEAVSPFYVGGSPKWLGLQEVLVRSKDSWLARLFGLLCEGVSPSDSEKVFENCSFITFNYDRCIEQYLRMAFQQVMNRSASDAITLTDQIPIVHIYGSLGPLPDSEGNGISFAPLDHDIAESAGSIRTFTEGVQNQTRDTARNLIKQAEHVVFLGFAFDQLNIEALFDQPLTTDQLISGTGYGLNPSDFKRIETHVAPDRGNLKAQLGQWKCNTLIAKDRFRENLLA
jgi:SIR2-like domain